MVAGINDGNVTRWLVDNVDGLTAPFAFELITGGASNLTFLVTDAGGRRLVLRRPPTSHLLASAHDMAREYRIISALAPTTVPVAPALGFCDDPSVNDRPFYVMDYVDGHIFRRADDVERLLDLAGRQMAGRQIVDVLVALHAIDVDAVGLGDLGRRGGYIERQLKRWQGQFERSQEQEREGGYFRPAEIVTEVHDRLAAAVPDQSDVAIAHGDYRLDNTMIGDDGRLVAVFDWELCTLGDPLADVGTLLMYWSDRTDDAAADPRAMRMRPATAAEGMPTKAEIASRYAAATNRDVSSLAFYEAFAHWRLACIMEGVFARFAGGAMGDQQRGSRSGEATIRRAELAARVLDSGH